VEERAAAGWKPGIGKGCYRSENRIGRMGCWRMEAGVGKGCYRSENRIGRLGCCRMEAGNRKGSAARMEKGKKEGC
jgi:hypothetical protein